MADLASGVLEFCALLRDEHAFMLGRAETHDAVRAAELIGLADRSRLRTALRAVCCSRPEDIAIFDRRFDDFFSSGATGVPQSDHVRRYRPGESGEPPPQRPPGSLQLESESPAQRWQTLQTRYSPVEGAAPPPSMVLDDDADALAQRVLARLRLGRARRLRPQARGRFLDLRRTIRASLQTGGEIVALRRRGYPLRNPRFIVLIDASRSMGGAAASALQFAHALCRRTLRASTFVFSTELREITRDLRRGKLGELGAAWGGGTRIGASLQAFVCNFGSRLDDHTYVIVASDGLDVGELGALEHAMREIARRSAAIAWVNPHAAQPGFAPTARGMQAVLPYIASLSSWQGLADA
ncbi:MAG TPA: VWA domain-containing protein [Candidatus Acidoferrum sp.]|nr:VWA domain-containing protein [Candidatus Acidoferrum sp.]